jgi:hypothetical protein
MFNHPFFTNPFAEMESMVNSLMGGRPSALPSQGVGPSSRNEVGEERDDSRPPVPPMPGDACTHEMALHEKGRATVFARVGVRGRGVRWGVGGGLHAP